MIKKILNLNLKYILIIIFFTLFNQPILLAQDIKKILINGNDRVSDETVIMFSDLKIGDSISQERLNNALKQLYFTNYFSKVTINNVKGNINILVEENPIIQKVVINGIKDKNILENLNNITIKVEKYPFVENQVNDQILLLKNILKSYGYYFVKLEAKVEDKKNNSVNLIYNFNLGEIAKINKINFIGQKIFKDSTLRNIIKSEESKFWKFITRNKFLDQNRIKLDVSRLSRFYKNRGYFNSTIKSTTAVITDNNQFELVFNINAGNKYYFDKIFYEDESNLPTENLKEFNNKFTKLKGKTYSKKEISNLIDEINDFTLVNDFVFLNAKFTEVIKDNNKIDIKINFDTLDKFFVKRINILGNYITDEKVIRNSLIVDEGDPYNEILFNKSIQNLKAKNIFKSVNFNTKDINDLNKVIDLTVEEKPTGEIFAGAGTGTTGSSLTAGVKENNYLGLGIKLDTNFVITDDSLKGKFSVINPNYNNSDKTIKAEVESSTNDFMTSSGYKTNRTGLTLGTEFEQYKDLFINLEISNFYEDLETSSTANDILKRQEGNYFENLLNYSISLNKLDQNFQPTTGYVSNFSQTLPIYSDDVSIENSFIASKYHSINEDLILSAKLFMKSINSLEDNVRVSKRVYVPGRRLRGFESGKIGPRDGTQYIGGNYATALNFNSTLPNLIFENESIDFNFFIDLANVWEVDYDNSLDSNKIRSSTGLAVNWFTGIGPLTFSYAIPISEAETDVTEKFRFQIGTSF
tara:strand:+ start:3496 stop:5751 length:2256 start_codon:yes stop_codon:yes gene_type:complete